MMPIFRWRFLSWVKIATSWIFSALVTRNERARTRANWTWSGSNLHTARISSLHIFFLLDFSRNACISFAGYRSSLSRAPVHSCTVPSRMFVLMSNTRLIVFRWRDVLNLQEYRVTLALCYSRKRSRDTYNGLSSAFCRVHAIFRKSYRLQFLWNCETCRFHKQR